MKRKLRNDRPSQRGTSRSSNCSTMTKIRSTKSAPNLIALCAVGPNGNCLTKEPRNEPASYVILSAGWLTSYVLFCCVAFYLHIYIHSLYNTIILKTNNYSHTGWECFKKKKKRRKLTCKNPEKKLIVKSYEFIVIRK